MMTLTNESHFRWPRVSEVESRLREETFLFGAINCKHYLQMIFAKQHGACLPNNLLEPMHNEQRGTQGASGNKMRRV